MAQSVVAVPLVATVDQFPCVFRQELIDEVPCQACSQKDKMASLYSCAIYQQCTVGSHGVTEDGTSATPRVKVCIACNERNEVG